MKVGKITLRISILYIYVITFIVLMSLLITLGSLSLLNAISFTSNNLLKDTTTLVLQELKSQGNSPESLSRLSKSLLENGFIDQNQMVQYSLYVTQNTTKFQLKIPTRIVSWVDTLGNSVSTFLEPDGTYSTAVIKRSESPPVGKQFYRDHQNQIIKTLTIPALDLRKATFWLDAMKYKQFIWTDAYRSIPNKNVTTSAVTPIYDKSGQLLGVFSIDIAMEGVSDFLQSLKIGKEGVAFIINGKDELIAFPGMNKEMYEKMGANSLIPIQAMDKPWVGAALTEFKKIKKPLFTFTYDHNRYVANFPYLPEEIAEVAEYAWKVGVVVPEKDFTGNLQQQNIWMIALGILILLCGILIASIFSKLVTTRLKMLVDETEKIKNFQFEGKKIESGIKEVHLLANAIYSMKMNLHSFKKYLPANLVQQLIQSGQDICLGGEIKTLSILFSDINNFTNITETMSPHQLMVDLSEYLDKVSSVISAQQGTIDKFIGDSIMAFWSAPLVDINHCEHACRSALLCRDKIRVLNDNWRRQGKAPFITRFGIHTGEVIVGNVGSEERMNYTAIGDSINMTSRIEGLNKKYGTLILASARVVELVGELFVFRMVDITAIKGKSGGHTIYELLAENGYELGFDLDAYQVLFQQGFFAYQHQDWYDAITAFKKALALYPEDTVAPVFILRCEQFIKTPPPANWDGVWRDYFTYHDVYLP